MLFIDVLQTFAIFKILRWPLMDSMCIFLIQIGCLIIWFSVRFHFISYKFDTWYYLGWKGFIWVDGFAAKWLANRTYRLRYKDTGVYQDIPNSNILCSLHRLRFYSPKVTSQLNKLYSCILTWFGHLLLGDIASRTRIECFGKFLRGLPNLRGKSAAHLGREECLQNAWYAV